ncbi:MAG: hypothetical protein ABIO36_02280, partial [Pyrinomonadaceae bacterium]
MDIGTAEIIDGLDDQKPKRPGVSGTSPTGGSGGGKNPGGGGDRPDDSQPASPEAFVPNKSRILTAFLLLVVLMTFGGLM